MKLMDALTLFDRTRPNQHAEDLKIRWVSQLEMMIWRELAQTHVCEGMPEEFEGYGLDTPRQTQLMAPSPYDDIYLHYLAAQSDLVNQETEKYNNDILLFQTSYSNLCAWWKQHYREKDPARYFRI